MKDTGELQKQVNHLLGNSGMNCFDLLSWPALIMVYDGLSDKEGPSQLLHDLIELTGAALMRKAKLKDEQGNTDLHTRMAKQILEGG